MDTSAAAAPNPAAQLFALDQKFDFSALLKSAASTIASLNASTSLANVVDTSTLPATSAASGTSTAVPIPVSQLPPFTAMRPIYAPSGYGRQILIYDSRSYPGHRREFAYKTRFTNQSGLTTVYYRCMACRALRHRLQRILPKDKLPAVPCIAVKNDLLINDPDYPEASDHFCTPLTVQESNHRLKVTFERGYKRARMKIAAEEKNAAEKAAAAAIGDNSATATCEITEQPLSLDQYFWMKNESSPLGSNGDDASHSTTSDHDGHEVKPENLSSLLFDQRSTVTNETTSNSDVDIEEEQPQSGKSRLDALIRLQDEREHSTSPNENVFPSTPVAMSAGFPPAMSFFAPFMQNNPDLTSLMNLQSIVNNLTKNSTEISKALKKPPKNSAAAASLLPGAHVNEIINKYIKSSWDLPENSGNSRSAAELTCTLILSLARHVPPAHSSMKEGKWARKDYMGEEVYGKTLAIIGLGRIGQEVASRMQAFGMKVIGFDPIVSAEEAAKRNIALKQLDEIWPLADYITVHVPLIPQTKDLLNRETLKKCKAGVKIINVARGGIINEADLVEALDQGHVGGAAVDVFVEEPPTYKPLVDHPKVICTPHLGASTIQAQQRVAVEVAENIVNLNNGTGLFGALNAAALAAVLDDTKAQYVRACTSLAQVLATLSGDSKNIKVEFPNAATGLQKAMQAGTIVGVLQAKKIEGANLINAEGFGAKEGINVSTELATGNEITLIAGDFKVRGYPSPAGTIISAINGNKIPVPLLAAGILAISTSSGATIPEKLRSKVSVEYGLIGGGRVALFVSELTSDEASTLSNFVVVHF